jgi:hypothetical protein
MKTKICYRKFPSHFKSHFTLNRESGYDDDAENEASDVDSVRITKPDLESIKEYKTLAPPLAPELAPLNFSKVGNMEMKSDKMFGWRPQAGKLDIPPIPLCFGLVEYNIDDLIKSEKIVYMGPRY